MSQTLQIVKPGSFCSERLSVVCVNSRAGRLRSDFLIVSPSSFGELSSPPRRSKVFGGTSLRADPSTSSSSVLTTIVSSSICKSPRCSADALSNGEQSRCLPKSPSIGRVVSLRRFRVREEDGGDIGGVGDAARSEYAVSDNVFSGLEERGLKYARIEPRLCLGFVGVENVENWVGEAPRSKSGVQD